MVCRRYKSTYVLYVCCQRVCVRNLISAKSTRGCFNTSDGLLAVRNCYDAKIMAIGQKSLYFGYTQLLLSGASGWRRTIHLTLCPCGGSAANVRAPRPQRLIGPYVTRGLCVVDRTLSTCPATFSSRHLSSLTQYTVYE